MTLANASVTTEYCSLTNAVPAQLNPARDRFRLTGNVIGHPRFRNGEVIFTSRVVDWKPCPLGGFVAITKNGSRYMVNLAVHRVK